MALASKSFSHPILRHKSPPPPLPLHRHTYQPRLLRLQTITHAASNSSDIEVLEDTIIVAGGGPAGLAAALALHKIGMQTLVLERSSSLPTSGAALGLWTNAWKALDALGAGNRLRELHPVISDVQLCRQDGRVLRKFSLNDCDGGPHEFRGVRRASLVQSLAEQLPEELILYNSEVLEVRPVRNSPSSNSTSEGSEGATSLSSDEGLGAEVVLKDGRILQCAAVVGCDGARSPVAEGLGKPTPNYVGQVAIRGIASIREGESPESIRQVWSNGPRAGMYPLSSTELYWFVCFDAPADAPVPATPAEIRREAAAVVKGWQWNLEKIVEATPLENLSRSRIGDRWDLGPGPLSRFSGGGQQGEEAKERNGGIIGTLAGDALHPMTPNLGQGGCCALEDSVVLARKVRRSGAQQLRGAARKKALESAFVEYEKQRTARCLPLVVRSHLMGVVLQLPFPPVSAARDWVVANKFDPSHFLDHATFDCGTL